MQVLKLRYLHKDTFRLVVLHRYVTHRTNHYAIYFSDGIIWIFIY